jgi:FSR family fosmidomycin resistance protein-like MFS transporter
VSFPDLRPENNSIAATGTNAQIGSGDNPSPQCRHPEQRHGKEPRLSQLAAFTSARSAGTDLPGKAHAQRTLAMAGVAHALHDGFTDMIYVLLPVWQAEFALSYGALAVLRALYVGSLAALQVPSGHLARHLNARTVLVLGTLLSAGGYTLAGLSGGLVGLCASLALAGAGGSTQHPLASAAVSRAYGEGSARPARHLQLRRRPRQSDTPAGRLSAADRDALAHGALGRSRFGVVVALLIRWLMPLVANAPSVVKTARRPAHESADRGGFSLLLAIGVLDSACAWPSCCSCRFFSRPRAHR